MSGLWGDVRHGGYEGAHGGMWRWPFIPTVQEPVWEPLIQSGRQWRWPFTLCQGLQDQEQDSPQGTCKCHVVVDGMGELSVEELGGRGWNISIDNLCSSLQSLRYMKGSTVWCTIVNTLSQQNLNCKDPTYQLILYSLQLDSSSDSDLDVSVLLLNNLPYVIGDLIFQSW